MKKKFLLTVIIILIGIITFGTISISAATYGGWTYSLNGGNVTITKCDTFKSGNVVVPDNILGYPVTGIAANAFYDCRLINSITIPASIRSIGNYAFWYCINLESVRILNSQTFIGNSAFAECYSLKSITIPDDIYRINSATFCNCRSLKNVTIPDGIMWIDSGAFMDCSSLENITIPNSVTNIGISAFNGCSSLTDVYYNGTEAEWNEISIDSSNLSLTNATIHFIPNTKTTLSNNDKTFVITPINVENGKTVILALYNGDVFVEMQSALYAGEAIPFTTAKTYTKAKVLIWDDLTSLKPVCSIENVK